jgi:hypothetical protein
MTDLPRKPRRQRQPQKAEDGIWLLVAENGQAFLTMRGTEQPNPDAIRRKRKHIVEVGPKRAVAFKVRPMQVLSVARLLIRSCLPHALACGGCSDFLADMIDEVDEAMNKK